MAYSHSSCAKEAREEGVGETSRPALDLLLRLQRAEAWAGPTASPRGQNTLPEKGTSTEKSVREETAIL